jgi:hypothetical protein
MDNWSYDAGVTGGAIAPNTGRWTELLGSGSSSDIQYFSQHGYGGGGANVAPFAMVARARSLSTDGTYNQTVRYATGIEDLGVAPSTPLLSATINFDLMPGITVRQSDTAQDMVFNDVPAWSVSFGGTDPAPGATLGFTDHHNTSGFPVDFFHMNGNTYQSQPFAFTRRFDRVTVDLDFVTDTFDVSITKDFNTSTTDFDPGNSPIAMVTGAPFTTPISQLDAIYFRAHHDPGNGSDPAGLEKTFIDNFYIQVEAMPEPSSAAALLAIGAAMLLRRPRRQRRPTST